MEHLEILKEIHGTLRRCLALQCVQVTGESELSLCESKFGGYPYIPSWMKYPETKSGNPLRLLAQINCSDLSLTQMFTAGGVLQIDSPDLMSTSIFPNNGLLQFFIDQDDESYGVNRIDYSNSLGGFHVQYISDKKKYENPMNLDFLEYNDFCFPIMSPQKIIAHHKTQPITPSSLDFFKIFGKYIENDKDIFWEYYYDLINFNNIHQMGGYPSFIMGGFPAFAENVPDFLRQHDDYIVLLQIGHSDWVMFGDCGIATFFIREQDLKSLDFSNVKYYWDCY